MTAYRSIYRSLLVKPDREILRRSVDIAPHLMRPLHSACLTLRHDRVDVRWLKEMRSTAFYGHPS